MDLITFTILAFVLFLGCIIGLGMSYDEEQLGLQKEDKSTELVDSLTVGQKSFLYIGMLAGTSGGGSMLYLLMLEIMKNGH